MFLSLQGIDNQACSYFKHSFHLHPRRYFSLYRRICFSTRPPAILFSLFSQSCFCSSVFCTDVIFSSVLVPSFFTSCSAAFKCSEVFRIRI
jgi:hypothetical protein